MITTHPDDLRDVHFTVPHSILTVGELRRILADAPADAQIVMDDPANSWYVNISQVIVPSFNDHSEWSAVTLVWGADFDCRQI